MADVTLTLYKNKSDSTVVGKTLSDALVVTGTFRGEVDILTPTVAITRDLTGATIREINLFNYVKITELNRFYFVNDIVILPTGLITLSLAEDVLQSFKASIRNLSCLIERCEAAAYIDDKFPDTLTLQQATVNVAHHTMSAYSGDYDYRTILTSLSDSGGNNTHLNYILTIGGAFAKRVQTGTDSVFSTELPQLKIICTKGFLSTFFDKMNSLWGGITNYYSGYKDMVLGVEVIPEAILRNDSHYKSVQAGTATKDTSDVIGKITIGTGTLTINANGDSYDPEEGTSSIPWYGFVLNSAHYEIEKQWKYDIDLDLSYLNSSQYKKLSIKFDPFGMLEIPVDELNGSTAVYVKLKHSLISGEAQLYYRGTKNATFIPFASQQFDYQIPWVDKGEFGKLLVTAAKAVTAVGSAIKGVAEGETAESESNSATKGKSGKSAQAIVNGMAACIDAIPKPEMKGQLRATIMDAAPTLIVATRPYQRLSQHLFGWPSMKTAQLSALQMSTNDGGFVKIAAANYSNFKTGTDPEPLGQELTLIDNLLRSGVIISQES